MLLMIKTKGKDNICGYIVCFIQKIVFWHNHLVLEVVFSKEGKILMVYEVCLFS